MSARTTSAGVGLLGALLVVSASATVPADAAGISYVMTVTVTTGPNDTPIGKDLRSVEVKSADDPTTYDAIGRTVAASGSVNIGLPSAPVPAGDLYIFVSGTGTNPSAPPNPRDSLAGSYAFNRPNTTDQSFATVNLDRAINCSSTAKLTGTPRVGEPLTTSGATFMGAPTTWRYYWYRVESTYPATGNVKEFTLVQDGANAATNSATYVPTSADAGHQLEVDVEAASAPVKGVTAFGYCNATDAADLSAPVTGPGGSSGSSASTTVKPLAAGPSSPATPVIAGKARASRTLRLSVAETGEPTAIQWYRIKKRPKHARARTVAIPGATSTSYRVKRKDRGCRIFAQVAYLSTGLTLSSARKRIR